MTRETLRLRSASCVAALLALGCSHEVGIGNSSSFGDAAGPEDGSGDATDDTTGDDSAGMTGGASTGDDSVGPDPKFDLGMQPDAPPSGGGIPRTCDEAATGQSTIGCEFFATDLDLVWPYDNLQYAVAVANVQLDEPATVEAQLFDGASWQTVTGPEVLDPLELHTFLLPDRHVDGSGLRARGAYRIVSDVPIAAYQFEPLEAGESYTSDASLLYPTHAWDTLHYVLAQPRLNVAHESYFAVVAATDDTLVEITPSIDTKAGPGVPAGTAGVPFQVTLHRGDLLQVAVAPEGGDPTGTRIESNEDHPIAVFAGNTCAEIPMPSAACDHLQEQLFGVRLWGERFVASRVAVRSTDSQHDAEPSLWQIFASENDTELTFTAAPVITGLPASPVTLQAGETLELLVTGPLGNPGDFTLTASKPIALVDYMTGSSTVKPFGEPSLGDPSQVQLAPVEQFLPRYVILVPDKWIYDVLTLTRPTGKEIRIDGEPVDDAVFLAVGPDYEVARVPVDDGVHVLDGDAPFSVIVTGYDDDDSYAYLGGAGTIRINPDPAG